MKQIILIIFTISSLVAWDNIYEVVKFGKVKEVKAYLDKGGDVNKKNEDGISLLSLSILGNKDKISEFLINNNADINARDNDGFTPLVQLCGSGKKASMHIAKLLFKKGAKIQKEDREAINEFSEYFPSKTCTFIKNH